MPTKLTDAKVKALRPRACAYFEWDSQAAGLALKVTPQQRKRWAVQLKFPGSKVIEAHRKPVADDDLGRGTGIV